MPTGTPRNANGNGPGVLTDTPGFPLFDLVNNADYGAKNTLAGVGNRQPGFPANVLRLVKAIAKKAPGPLNPNTNQPNGQAAWQYIETAMPGQAVVLRALSVIGGRFWFDGQPFSPPQYGGGNQP